MQKRKSIALICAVVLASLVNTCAQEPNVKSPVLDNNTAPPPPIAVPLGVKRTIGMNILTGKPEKENEVGKRPLAVMIDNVQSALPQRGLSEADIIYEIVTESGITRLMAIFSDYESMPPTGPVRSARDQHVRLMLPLNTAFLHIGTSTYAFELLDTYKYSKFSINGLYQTGALKLDVERTHKTAIEHCWFTSGELFTNAAQKFELSLNDDCMYSAFKFSSEPRIPSGNSADKVSVRFSSYCTSVFDYIEADEKYYKSQFGKPHIDENNSEQLSFDNVLILFTDITKYPDGVLAKVRFNLGGVGYYFSKGKVEQVRWMKTADNEPLLILNNDGTEQHVDINIGKSYLAMVDLSMYEHFKISEQEADPQSTTSSMPADN